MALRRRSNHRSHDNNLRTSRNQIQTGSTYLYPYRQLDILTYSHLVFLHHSTHFSTPDWLCCIRLKALRPWLHIGATEESVLRLTPLGSLLPFDLVLIQSSFCSLQAGVGDVSLRLRLEEVIDRSFVVMRQRDAGGQKYLHVETRELKQYLTLNVCFASDCDTNISMRLLSILS